MYKSAKHLNTFSTYCIQLCIHDPLEHAKPNLPICTDCTPHHDLLSVFGNPFHLSLWIFRPTTHSVAEQLEACFIRKYRLTPVVVCASIGPLQSSDTMLLCHHWLRPWQHIAITGISQISLHSPDGHLNAFFRFKFHCNLSSRYLTITPDVLSYGSCCFGCNPGVSTILPTVHQTPLLT